MGADLAIQQRRVVAALVPALLEVGCMILDFLRFSGGLFPLGEFAGTQPAANRLALHVERFRDRALRVPEPVQLNDLFVPFEPALPTLIAADLLLSLLGY